MVDHRWYLEVEVSCVERVDQFLSAAGYSVFEIGDSHSSWFIYFHNSDTKATLKYGRSSAGMVAKNNFRVYNTFDELIDAHFDGVNDEEV